SKQGLEQAAHTFGIVRSLTLAGQSTESIVDCLVIAVSRNST
ncbi:IS1595 family transposase, partial [Haloarchaeobius iranensis]